jgi:outer membrane protein assembly factor BamB
VPNCLPQRRHLVALLTLAVVAGLIGPWSAAARATCAPAQHPGGDWPVQGQNAFNTRNQPRERTIGPAEVGDLAPVWEVNSAALQAPGTFQGTPVVAGGCVFVGSTTGWVLALNADTGELVWKTKLAQAINNSVTVDGGEIFAVSGLRVVSLDRQTGRVLWESAFIDTQEGSDTYASPVVFTYRGRRTAVARRVVFTGVSGGTAETGDDERRGKFVGKVVLLDGDTGKLLKATWVIPRKDWRHGYAGGGVWATAAVDPAGGHVYVGTGNPFQPEVQHERTNAIIKVDVDPSRRTFGRIVGHYTGTLDEYVDGFSQMPCADVPGNPPPWYPQGVGACADQDLDFGASPNLFRDADGNLMVGEGQKSGEYHVVEAATMTPRHVSLVGPPLLVGGIVGNTAIDANSVYGPQTVAGYLWSVSQADGSMRWLAPVADGAHYALATSVANGVVYTIDLAGFLRAYDAETGAPLLVRPQSSTTPVTANLGGGVAIARNTVYAVTGGVVVAHRLP